MVIDVILKLGKLVKSIIVEHQSLINILFLVKEKHTQTFAKKLLNLFIKKVGSTVFICLVNNLY